jgi:hypothetical protein
LVPEASPRAVYRVEAIVRAEIVQPTTLAGSPGRTAPARVRVEHDGAEAWRYCPIWTTILPRGCRPATVPTLANLVQRQDRFDLWAELARVDQAGECLQPPPASVGDE